MPAFSPGNFPLPGEFFLKIAKQNSSFFQSVKVEHITINFYHMTLDIYQVDAFSNRVFGGNPAAVVPLSSWLPDETLQAVAAENNLSETAFFVPHAEGFHIRWFTPLFEVRLCGHATVASAHVLWNELGYEKQELKLHSKSGTLGVKKKDTLYTLDFPSCEIKEVSVLDGLENALGTEVQKTFRGRDDFLAVLGSQSDVSALKPDFMALAKLEARGLIATAAGEEVDFVSRCFYPKYGVDEDPVTGSAHTLLTPYWANRLGKNEMLARQLSKRGGELRLNFKGPRTEISGEAITYLKGKIMANG